MKIEIGQKAPAISLYDSAKKMTHPTENKDSNVLLLFFPLAFTGVCTAELCSIRDNIAVYNGVNAKVFGISVDSVFTLAKYKEEQALNFPLLSDFNREASTAYGALYETFALEMKGVSKRSAFVVDKEGIIKYAEVLENAGDLPDFEAIQKVLTSLS